MMHRGKAASSDEIKKTSSGKQGSVVDNELSFRAMDGFGDDLRFDVSCGFDVAQLETLFPEEMSAYQKWKKVSIDGDFSIIFNFSLTPIDFVITTYQLHDAYTENSEDTTNKTTLDDDACDHEEEEKILKGEVNSGRLFERLSNFDVRTDKMEDDWYIQFSDVRRGSFLPRSGIRKSTTETSEGTEPEPKKRGRAIRNRTSWHNFHPSSMMFLHWVGFDPTSALSPPNEETTQALAFLAHDFFGKIVEKV